MIPVPLSAWTDWLGVGINTGLLAVASGALCFAGKQAAAAASANQLTRDAQQRAAEREQAAAQQSIDDSRRANRPYLWAEVVPGIAGPPTWDLTIRNMGRSAARDITLDAPWPTPGDALTAKLHQHLTRPFDLPPGASLRFFWRLVTEADEQDPQPSGMPAECEVTLHYRGDDPEVEPFTETRLLDAPTRVGIIPTPNTGQHNKSSDPHLAVLRDIDHALRALNIHVGELHR